MSLYEIDHDATQRRLDAITSNGLRALGDCARRSAEIDKRVAEQRAHQEREKQAMDERVKRATAERTVAKPATLSLGGEEFQETRRGMPAPAVRGRAGAPAPPTPRKTLALGAPEDPDDRLPVRGPGRGAPVSWFGSDQGHGDPPGTGRDDATVTRRPGRPGSPDGDDDLSGRTWLR